MQYNPAEPMDADRWLSFDEDERLYAIQCWLSELIGAEIEDCLIDAVPILAVENQLAMDKPPVVRATLGRLTSSGIDRATAIQVMSDVMAETLGSAVSEPQNFDPAALTQALEQIDPAEIPVDYSNHGTPLNAQGDVPAFSADHRKVLIEFGERHVHEKAMSWPETAGFLFAVQLCPDMVMPSEWIEIIQGEAVFDNLDEARAVNEARMTLMNWISECLQQEQPAIPVDCKPDPAPLRILEEENNFSLWCRGVTEGHDWLEQSWNKVLTTDSDDDRAQSMALTLFMFFTGRAMAERVVEEMARESADNAMNLEELANKFHALIEPAAVEYAAIGLEYRQAPSVQPTRPAAPQPVRSRKIGRNQPCPCGSGKKYKKCCGRPRAKHLH